jgi:predicted 3-demethylubiquinone-9 3-methyltransferase (glyoxalase superfamily)
MALNGGPMFKFSEAVSFEVICETQDELDYYWSKLSGAPDSEVCGWCKDKFGVSWQIVPAMMDAMFIQGTETQRNRVMKVVMASKKLDIAKLKEAYHG